MEDGGRDRIAEAMARDSAVVSGFVWFASFLLLYNTLFVFLMILVTNPFCDRWAIARKSQSHYLMRVGRLYGCPEGCITYYFRAGGDSNESLPMIALDSISNYESES